MRRPVAQRLSILPTIALGLTSCVLGPIYHGPPAAESETPAVYKNSAFAHWKVAQPGGKESHEAWWEIFRDSILNRLEEQALAANQELRVAAARVDQARAQARVAAADFFPNIDINARGERVRTSNTLPYQKGELIGSNPFAGASGGTNNGEPLVLVNQPLTTTQNHFRVPAELNWEVDLFGRVRHEYGAARAEAQAAAADYRAMHLSVTANVAAGYFMLRAADAELDVINRALAARREALRIAEERLQAGLTSELDVARARADLALNEAAIAQIERSRGEMENALATLIGQPASVTRFAHRPIADTVPRVRPGIPSELLERRPDIARAERELAAASERVGVARAAFFPQIKITGAAGFESADFGLLFHGESRFWDIGPSIHVPIFEGGRNVANLNAARARYEESLGQYRQQLLVAFQEVENALSDLRTIDNEYDAQSRVIEAAQRSFDLSQQQYQKGAVNFLDVLDTERNILQAQRTQAQLLGQRMQATVQLIKSLGGDWR